MNTALVVGGTGPTGPYVVNGLVNRGFQVTILHTGRHESEIIGPEVEHIHSDPFDVDRTAAVRKRRHVSRCKRGEKHQQDEENWLDFSG